MPFPYSRVFSVCDTNYVVALGWKSILSASEHVLKIMDQYDARAGHNQNI